MLKLEDSGMEMLKECVAFLARQRPKNPGATRKVAESLRRSPLILHQYACHTEEGTLDLKKHTCHLYKDWSPLGFSFVMKTDDKFWFNGGLLFHGEHDGFGSGGSPTFSVCLEPTQGWSIHT